MIGEIIPRNIGPTLDWMTQNISKTNMTCFMSMEMVGIGFKGHQNLLISKETEKRF